jgi:hypothetical protein
MNVFKIVFGKLDRTRLLVKLMCRWKNNFEIDVKNHEGMNCIYWANDKVEWWAFVRTVTNLQTKLQVILVSSEFDSVLYWILSS